MSEKKGVMSYLAAIPGRVAASIDKARSRSYIAGEMKNAIVESQGPDKAAAPSYDPWSKVEYNCNSIGEFNIRNSDTGARVKGMIIDGNLKISDVRGMNEKTSQKYESGQRRQAMPYYLKGSYKTIVRDLAKA